jgi:hypothetical protein
MLAADSLDSAAIGNTLPLRTDHPLQAHPVSFVHSPLFRFAPDSADFEDTHVKSHPAVTATHRRAQNDPIDQVHPAKMRRAQIAASASLAVDGHNTFMLLEEFFWGRYLLQTS